MRKIFCHGNFFVSGETTNIKAELDADVVEAVVPSAYGIGSVRNTTATALGADQTLSGDSIPARLDIWYQ